MIEKTIVEEVKEAIKTRKSISISRVPPQTMELFLSLAKEEFCDDYGMALRECVNALIELKMFKESLIPLLYDIEHRVNNITNNTNVKQIRSLDGKVLKEGGDI